MKKSLALGLVITLLSLGLTACASSQPDTSKSGVTEPGRSTSSASTSNVAEPETFSYPEGSVVDMIIPWSAGGANDLYLRILSEGFQNLTGIANPPSNISGASGSIGFTECLSGAADGYTVCGFSPNIIINSLDENSTYSLKDVQYIIGVNEDIRAICVPSDSPLNNLQDMIDYAKDHPGQLNVAHGGPGTISYYALVDFANKAGIEVIPVPFDGSTPGITACMGKHVDAVMPTVGECLSYVNTDQLKCIGVLGMNRADDLPDVGTAKEIGVDCVHSALRGIFCKAGTPDEVVKYLHDTYKTLLEDPEIQKQFEAVNVSINYYSTKEVTELMNDLYEVYSELVAAEK